MRKKVIMPIAFFLVCLNFILLSCSVNSELEVSNNLNGFLDTYNAFHNEYYKNNAVKSVTINSNQNLTYKVVYHYNTLGDLYKYEYINIDENDIETVNEISTRIYVLEYENDVLTKKTYPEGSLLTHTVYEYYNDKVIKKSDVRNEEVFYFEAYNYTENDLLENSVFNCLTSSGTRGGCFETTTYEYIYDNGNLLKVDKTINGQTVTNVEYKYVAEASLPFGVRVDKEEFNLSYDYFK